MIINMKVLEKITLAFKKDEDVLMMISDALKNMIDYVKVISEENILVTSKKWSMSKDELLYEVKKLDTKRRSIHNQMILDIKFINRLADNKEYDKFYTGGEKREEIGEAAIEYVNYSFRRRYKK